MPPTNISTCGVLQSNTKPELKTLDWPNPKPGFGKCLRFGIHSAYMSRCNGLGLSHWFYSINNVTKWWVFKQPYTSAVLLFQGSHQATKIIFPDIPGRFLIIPDGTSSIYHLSGQLTSHTPNSLPSSFNAVIISFGHIQYLVLTTPVFKWVFYSVRAFIVSYKHKRYLTAQKFPVKQQNSGTFQYKFPDIPWFSSKWEPCVCLRTISNTATTIVHHNIRTQQ